ncbi:hypothetical protein [Nocardia sp. NPDC059228]|uniref:hypothetical protein n=1 Tax=Nocardia sp. NPDC059228 TaxID=3346777 RepID=UPI0036CAB306
MTIVNHDRAWRGDLHHVLLCRGGGRCPEDMSEHNSSCAGIVQFARKDDTAVNAYLGGRIGAPIKETATKWTVSGIRWEARKPGMLFWAKGGRRLEHPVSGVEVVTNP